VRLSSPPRRALIVMGVIALFVDVAINPSAATTRSNSPPLATSYPHGGSI